MKNALINILASIQRGIIRLTPPASAHRSKSVFFSKLDQFENSYGTHYQRPRQPIEKDHFQLPENESIAIVIQGPLVTENEFTLESIRIYLSNFPHHKIIVSTWTNGDELSLQKMSELGAHIVQSTPPEYGGPKNVNYQIVSSREGILKAKELGVEYVYKTRTDQRINGINVSAYLRKLQDIFPVQSNYMKSRLIGCSMTTLKYRPYGLGDMFMFGHIDDMLLYWDSKIDEREINNESLIDLSVLEYGKNRLAETYLCTNFLDRIGHDLSWTLKDTWHAYSSYFLVVDHMDLDLFWYKYNWREESRFNKESNHKLLHFRDWILLSSNDPSERESNYFNLKEGEKI